MLPSSMPVIMDVDFIDSAGGESVVSSVDDAIDVYCEPNEELLPLLLPASSAFAALMLSFPCGGVGTVGFDSPAMHAIEFSEIARVCLESRVAERGEVGCKVTSDAQVRSGS